MWLGHSEERGKRRMKSHRTGWDRRGKFIMLITQVNYSNHQIINIELNVLKPFMSLIGDEMSALFSELYLDFPVL